MKQVWIISSIGSNNHPATPQLFPSLLSAENHLREILFEYWQVLKLSYPYLKNMPECLDTAQAIIAALHTDGSWLWYEITHHDTGGMHGKSEIKIAELA